MLSEIKHKKLYSTMEIDYSLSKRATISRNQRI